jgi:Zn-dependent protease
MSVRVGRLSGVPVQIHVTWVIIFLLISYTIGFGFLSQADPSLSPAAAFGCGAVAALLLFACLLLHELGHVFAARRYGIRIGAISFFLLGGEAKLSRDPGTPREELAISVAGPAVSLALSPVFGFSYLFSEPGSMPAAIAFYLAFANGLVGAANLLPGYPLDGGRAVYAIVWAVLKDRARAIRAAAFSGQCLGLILAGSGVLTLFGSISSGIILVVLGWYVFDSAATAWEAHKPAPSGELQPASLEGRTPARG